MTAPDLLVADLLPLLRRFCAGEHGIALGGSCAKGTQRVQALLTPGPDGGVEGMREQRRDLAALVAEVAELTGD